MYLIMKFDSCYELCKTYKSYTKKDAEIFAEYMEKKQGLFGEYNYEVVSLDDIENIDIISEEELKLIQDNFTKKQEDYRNKLK